ncbi:MAG: tRNA uridine-5-carboxymethylaminomethyl(34) synthesis GTPase MnmE [Hyphomicrobium sp.]|jgi:tRNA modification GTPase
MVEPTTIFALSSAPGRAGVAVVRISGPEAGAVIDAMAAPRPKDRFAALRRIADPATGQTLDEALVLWLVAPRTETGEDVAELHLHGGPAIVKAVLRALSEIPGLRLAEPGEFARRAFHNGKLDLAQVEGLADLIDAETEAQRQHALAQMRGALSDLYEGWRRDLLEACALMEAAIDFSDESDVAGDAVEHAAGIVRELQASVAAHLADGHRGEILRDGFRVVLAGPPNAGKSSLLNALARRDAAIVSEEAGTTRDVLEVRLDLAGVPVIIADTAGIRDTEGAIEREGVRRALAHAREADLVLWLNDSTTEPLAPPSDVSDRGDKLFLAVASKIDIPGAAPSPRMLGISAHTRAGLDHLVEQIGRMAHERVGDPASPAITRERYRANLMQCMHALQTFMNSPLHEHELRAEDLRTAIQALGRITGRVDVEHVLGEIFGRFCIGK